MAAELGQTNDPVALIPGDPESIYTTFGAMIEYASLFEEAGNGLKSIDTSKGWSGPAANSFHDAFQTQPAKWLQVGDAFQSAATALDNYASTMSWAQQVAGDAITTWNSGKQNHQAATEMLANARSQLAAAASTAASKITNAAKAFPGPPGILGDIGSFFSSGWHDVEGAVKTGVADAVNGGASFLNAAAHDPGGLAATVGGIALTGISAAGEGAGVALDATGVGAIGGVPLNIASAAGMALGSTIAAGGLTSIALDAAGPDRVTVMQASSSGGTGGGGDEPPADTSGNQTVNEILKTKKGAILRVKLPEGSPSWEDIRGMTLNEVEAAADRGEPGFRTFAKLLKQARFNR